MNPTSSFPRKDPIWGTPVIEMRPTEDPWIKEYNSPRCGGWYSIDTIAASQVNNLSDRQKARLTSWLIEQRRSRIECPRIIKEVIEFVKQQKDMLIVDRVDKVLMHMNSKKDQVEVYFEYGYDPNNPIAKALYLGSPTPDQEKEYYELLAYSESISQKELESLINHLKDQNLIKDMPNCDPLIVLSLTIEGKIRLEEIQQRK